MKELISLTTVVMETVKIQFFSYRSKGKGFTKNVDFVALNYHRKNDLIGSAQGEIKCHNLKNVLF